MLFWRKTWYYKKNTVLVRGHGSQTVWKVNASCNEVRKLQTSYEKLDLCIPSTPRKLVSRLNVATIRLNGFLFMRRGKSDLLFEAL